MELTFEDDGQTGSASEPKSSTVESFAEQQRREYDEMYKKAISSVCNSLDTHGHRNRTSTSREKPKKEKQLIAAAALRLPTVMRREAGGRRGGAISFHSVAPMGTRGGGADRMREMEQERRGAGSMFRDGRQLADMGMGHEAARRFLDGLKRDPASARLNRAYRNMMNQGKCHARLSFAHPCPKPELCDECSVRGCEWQSCPRCGGMWTADTRAAQSFSFRRPGQRRSDSQDSQTGPTAEELAARELDALHGLDVNDLFPREGKDGSGAEEKAREMLEVARLLRKYHKAIKGMHTYYSNLGKCEEEDMSGAFTMDKGELKKFLDDCQLMGGALTRTQMDLIFIRVNWDGPAGTESKPSAGNAAVNDSTMELSLSEFTCLLLRVAKCKAPGRGPGSRLSRCFHNMMENSVLPRAHQDEQEYLRDALTRNRQLRLVMYMYRTKLKAVFNKFINFDNNLALGGSDKHLALRDFVQLLTETEVMKRADLKLTDVGLVFSQSQSEDLGASSAYEQDTDLGFPEFNEALLRIAVVQFTSPSMSLADKLSGMFQQVAGRLDGGEVKLDMKRMERMMQIEEEKHKARRNSIIVKSMWDAFKKDEEDDDASQDDMVPTPARDAAQLAGAWDAEAAFRRCLPQLEREGDEYYMLRHMHFPYPSRIPSSDPPRVCLQAPQDVWVEEQVQGWRARWQEIRRPDEDLAGRRCQGGLDDSHGHGQLRHGSQDLTGSAGSFFDDAPVRSDNSPP